MKHSTQTLPAKLAVMVLSVMLIVAFSFTGTQYGFVYAGTNGGVVSAEEVDLMVSLTDDMAGTEVTIPVDMSKADLQKAIDEGKVSLSLVRDRSKFYVDEEMYPNLKDGGDLSEWKTQRDTEKYGGTNDMFTDIKYEAGDKSLKVTMDINCYFYGSKRYTVQADLKDYSAPHGEGGPYIDLCGYFNLNANVDGKTIGTATAKVTPYPSYHTMWEVYNDIDAMAAYDGSRYVEKKSMGKSTAGRDMPYLIVAKDKKSVDDWMEYCDLVETDPEKALSMIENGQADDIKVPVLYTNIHANEIAAVDGIIDFAWKLIKEDTIDYKYLDGFTAEGEAQKKSEMGEVGAKGSLAIPDLVKDKATYLGWLKDGNRMSGNVDLEKYYNVSDNTYDIDKILDDVFFIIVPEENVDGRSQTTREAANGFDLNRDNSFQVTPETANMQHMIGTYNPVSVVEFHGRITGFQCEPCDPPHEPNFEYDLLAEHLMTGGEAIGIAAVANNPTYNSYVIPQRDYLEYTGKDKETYWADPWDDMSTSYTPQFAMLQGAAAYTVELPAYSEDATQLVSYGIVGNSAYVAKEKKGYLKSQAEIYKRGVNNENSDAYDKVGQWFCDQHDVEGAEADIFRPEYKGEGENGNFYPEAYIIPVDRANQKNLQAANDMIEWLTRNDVKVYPAKAEFKLGDVTYPAGTFIIPMHQAKRSVANGALNDGTLIQGWTILYSEGITAFNKTRGFDMYCTAKPADYKVLEGAMGDAMDYEAAKAYVKGAGSSFEGVEGKDVLIENVSEDSTAAINALLKDGKTPGMITEGENEGDFVIKYSDFESVKDKYTLTATGIDLEKDPLTVKAIMPMKVYYPGHAADAKSGFVGANRVNWNDYTDNYDQYALDLMNFQVTDKVSEADVIIGGGSLDGEDEAIEAIEKGTPYLTYTSNAADGEWYGQVYPGNLTMVGIEGVERAELPGAMDALAFVEYPEKTMVNATYVNEGDDIMYGYEAGYFKTIPEGAKALVKVKNETPLEGFIPLLDDESKAAYDEYLNGGILGFEYTKGGMDVVAFAQTLDNKVHQRDEYQFISNFIFSRSLSGDYVITEESVRDLQKEYKDAQKEANKTKIELEQAKAELEEAKAAGESSASEIEALKAAVEEAKAAAEAAQKEAETAKAALAEQKAKELTVKGLKVKAAKKKATVTFKKTKGATAYQVQYKLGKKAWKNAAKSTKKVKVVVKKLKKGKKYTFRVRTISKVNGKNVYGKWATSKAVKIK